MPKYSRRLAKALALCVAACRPPAPEQVLAPAAAPRAAEAPVPRISWQPRRSNQRLAYAVENSARFTVRSDTLLVTDSVSSLAEVAYAFTEPGARISGEVRSYRVRSSGQAFVTPSALALPFPLLAVVGDRPGSLRLLTPSAAPCVALATVVTHALRDLWFAFPETISVGSEWSDSSSFFSCRDGVSYTSDVVRSFRVASVRRTGGADVLTLVRTSRVLLHGAGQQQREPVTLTGTGGSELRYEFDGATGEILSASGRATLSLALRGSAREQLVEQESILRISRLP